MQALKDRITSKLSDKSKTKDKDASTSVKTSGSNDSKHATLGESHHYGSSTGAMATTTTTTNSTSFNAQSFNKGIRF